MIAGQGGNQLDTIQMDFTARRFDTFSEEFTIEYYDDNQTLQELDLTGATAQMQLKKRKSDASPFFSFDVAISGNTITISKNHLMMDLTAGKYWHDIEIKNADGDHITWIQGRFIIVEHITHYVDTILSYIKTTISSVVSIFNVPKVTYLVSFISTILLQNVITYKLKTFFSTTASFLGISFIIEEITTVFKSISIIVTVPKTILTTVFRAIVSITTNIYHYSVSRWSTKIEFQSFYST